MHFFPIKAALIIGVSSVLVTLAACSGQEDASPASVSSPGTASSTDAIQAGSASPRDAPTDSEPETTATCWDIASFSDPAMKEFQLGSNSRAVDCSEPHTLELIEIKEIPSGLPMPPSELRALAEVPTEDLTAEQREQLVTYREALSPPCIAALEDALGLPSSISTDGSVVAYPELNGFACLSRLPTDEQWVAGEERVQIMAYRQVAEDQPNGWTWGSDFQVWPGLRNFDDVKPAALSQEWLAEESCFDFTDDAWVPCLGADPSHSVYKSVATRIWIPQAGIDLDQFDTSAFCRDLNSAFGAKPDGDSGYGSANPSFAGSFDVSCYVAVGDLRQLTKAQIQRQYQLFADKPILVA